MKTTSTMDRKGWWNDLTGPTVLGVMRDTLYYVVIWAFIILYGYTAIDKLWDISAFIDAINAQVFPKVLTPYIAWGIPIIELILFSLLIIPKTQHLGLYLATGLMLVFTIYVGWGAVQDVGDRPCGCAGIFRTFSWTEHFWFNLYFLLGGIGAIACNSWKKKIREGRKMKSKRIGLSILVTLLVTLLSISIAACTSEPPSGPENFYRIEGDFFHQIEKSAAGQYLFNPDTGCVYAIRSEADKIPVSDNPKRMPVLFVTKLPDEPDWEEFDNMFSNTKDDINKEPPEGGSR